jgi:hypothetical protein
MSHRARPSRPLVVLVTLLAACVREPVEWTDAGGHLPGPSSADARLALDAGPPALVAPPVPPAAWAPAALCEPPRYARATATEWYAVGWIRRADNTALLAASRSDDGGRTWRPPVAVDSLDRGRTGCARPAPAVAADSASGYVHVAYFLEAPEGPGVFFSHSMERGDLFHQPVPISYGTRPSAVSVAAWRDTVAVAYEDPNGDRPRVGLALSRTMGHIFEDRMFVTGTSMPATGPRVAVGSGRLAVAWREGDSTAATGLRVRTARWR